MKKTFLVIFAVLLFLGLGTAKINHVVESDKNKIEINSSIKMECTENCPVSRWQLNWQIPKDAEINWVNGTEGRAEGIERADGSVYIKTETPPRDSELIVISMKLDKPAKKITDGLYRRELNIPGFKDRKTTVSVKNQDMISGKASFGFNTAFSLNKMSAKGKGPVNLRWKFGKGEETDYYEFFGYEPGGSEDDTYRVSVGTLGVVQQFKRFPAGVLSDREYNVSVNNWSAGEYVSGSIRIRDSLEEEFLPVLAHEVAHGINDRKLRWDDTESSYFDEGTSKYVEFLMRKKLYRSGEIEIGPAELFGESKEYRKEEDGRDYIYTVRSQGNRQKLWNYYQSNGSFMERWNPFDYPEQRDFGYAYSELIIRNHVMNNGTVRELYRKMNFSSKVEDPEEKWSFYSQHLDMTPCKYDSKDRFESFLDDINSFNYPIFMSTPNISNQEIVIEEIKLPERKEKKKNFTGRNVLNSTNYSSEEMFEGIRGFFSSFFEKLKSILKL